MSLRNSRSRTAVLDPLTVRILAALMAVASIVGIASFRRGSAGGGRSLEFRAEDNPPAFLQVVWPIVNLVGSTYPFLAAILPDVAYASPLNVGFPFDAVFQVAGLLLWGAGGLLVVWSARVLGRFMVVQIAISKDHEIVRTGPYARIRHPTYAGAMAMSIGVALLFLSVALVAVAILCVLIANYRARKEERLLASPNGFGEAYRAYMATTGRFLPRRWV